MAVLIDFWSLLVAPVGGLVLSLCFQLCWVWFAGVDRCLMLLVGIL